MANYNLFSERVLQYQEYTELRKGPTGNASNSGRVLPGIHQTQEGPTSNSIGRKLGNQRKHLDRNKINKTPLILDFLELKCILLDLLLQIDF